MSNPTLGLTFACVITFLLAVLVTGLSRHKRSAGRRLNVMGAIGTIETTLSPEGVVIVNGELWRARSNNGRTTNGKNKVRVVGVQGHLLLVELVMGGTDCSL